MTAKTLDASIWNTVNGMLFGPVSPAVEAELERLLSRAASAERVAEAALALIRAETLDPREALDELRAEFADAVDEWGCYDG